MDDTLQGGRKGEVVSIEGLLQVTRPTQMKTRKEV